MSVISVKGLSKSFTSGFWMHKKNILKNINFTVEPGEVTGFLGANGAGKTTSIKCILGLLKADAGEVKYFGNNNLTSKIKSKLGFLPERPTFYDFLTGYEILMFYGQLSGNLKNTELKQRIDHLLEKVNLMHVRDQKIRSYSKGMLQKLGLAQALVHRPDLIILDEPMSGLDPDGRLYLSDLIRDTATEGTAVFFSSHLLNDTEKLCDSVIVLKSGEVFYQGSTLEFIEKMDSNLRLTYVEKGVKKHVDIDDRGLLQSKIDELRVNKYEIIEIQKQRASLEEAFVSLVMSDEGGA